LFIVPTAYTLLARSERTKRDEVPVVTPAPQAHATGAAD
jgi:hypothetical protein